MFDSLNGSAHGIVRQVSQSVSQPGRGVKLVAPRKHLRNIQMAFIQGVYAHSELN